MIALYVSLVSGNFFLFFFFFFFLLLGLCQRAYRHHRNVDQPGSGSSRACPKTLELPDNQHMWECMSNFLRKFGQYVSLIFWTVVRTELLLYGTVHRSGYRYLLSKARGDR